MPTIDKFTGDYQFLSNFYPALVRLDGDLYPTVEHAYQAAKTHDPLERKKICSAATAGAAKKLGRKATLREDWEHEKIPVMRMLLEQKFARGVLRQKLLDTGESELIEGNYWQDFFWGVCDGVGKNWLGRLLMEVREQLRINSASK